ncbi:hypothetical protein GSI_11870 [Ganoderma sinense ZZ0214-1]|uniref:Uncharacterized protein n=1 Tax=Ganoderma sinense ZZ0214-1 TaxID=1077348 RepID=A0A2G8RX74_9APHY|nr:hypothetical protein GSI_11870 [Ganoderma sinense ZZ0214-1]
MALFWFYQGHRFNILEGIGCVEEYPNTFLSILLNTVWPVPIGLASAVYAILTLRGTLARTRDLRRLQIVETGLTTSRYYRLIVLAVANVLFTVPLSIYMVIINLREGLYPYRGLTDLHSGFGRVDSVAAVICRQSAAVVMVINFRIWTPIPCAIFFLIFGFTAEALARYARLLVWVTKPLTFRGARFGERVASGSDVSRVHLRRRPVVELGLWDTVAIQECLPATKSAFPVMDDGPGPGMAFIDIGGRLLGLGVTGISACRIERGSKNLKKGDIVAMSPIMEPPAAGARSSSPSIWSP